MCQIRHLGLKYDNVYEYDNLSQFNYKRKARYKICFEITELSVANYYVVRQQVNELAKMNIGKLVHRLPYIIKILVHS